MRASPLIVLLIACGGETDLTPQPTPYVFDGPEVEIPDVDLDAIERALSELWPNLRSYNATPALEAYQALAVEQTEVCPRVYEVDGNSYWADACTTAEGTQFSGFAFAVDYYDMPIGDVWVGDAKILQGGGRIERADGASLDIAGIAQRLDLSHVSEPAVMYHSTVQGTFTSHGLGSLDESWVGTGVRPDLVMLVYEHMEWGGRMIQFDGGLAGFDSALDAVVFDRVTLVESTLGNPCPNEPYGTVSVRVGDGVWADVALEGFDPDAWELAGSCSGRAQVLVRGESVGDIAINGRTLLDFEGAPW